MTSTDLFRGTLVRLGALTPADIPTLARWHQDAEFLRLYDSGPAYPKGEAELVRWLEEVAKAQDSIAFAVRLLEGDSLIGHLELDEIIWQHGVCGMALGIGERANRGKGYGYDATRLALGFAFYELNFHRVQVTVFSYNQPSIALLKRIGFQREGAYREFLQRDGKRFDMLLYGLLRREWEAGQQ